MKNLILLVIVLALMAGGIWYVLSGSEGKSNSFGGGVAATLTSVGDIQRSPGKYLNQIVTVEGEMTKECPTTGCWWYVKDRTGEIRADSLGGGFALPLNRKGDIVRTTGRLVRTEGGELQIAASGAVLR